ncbi:hypothetical protein COX05_03845 [candidate division WWE3 bacterium CG22_combo_CG10-13_8_21_14_all_39_12]|uniref:Histidine kinase N-terminal 7TM region domain-containing protein n=2 Tax=Katanobacteria TaxID=422282 RepID=A0A2M7X4L3_UNCKA|nr:MAG: hypothetical protein COX05_03845 [candidate division WWE3 bacterium CG22_combo_CG10-13_8_21_14_all_39_12]PJA41115.1 MAG: hypothetical protein CO179_00630 [candidate division WWE3 bacterium CG_4_9_14_3_um_filter_39_7]
MDIVDLLGLIIVAITFFANLLLSVMVLLKDRRSEVNRVFFMFISLLSLWVVSSFLWTITVFDEQLLNVFLRFDFFFATLGAFGFFVFAYVFPFRFKGFSSKWVLILGVVAMIVSVVSSSTNLVIKNTHLEVFSLSYTQGPLDIPYAILIFLTIVVSMYMLFSKYLKSDGKVRLQITYVLWGAGVSAFIVSVTSLLLWRIFNYLGTTQQFAVELIPNIGRFGMVIFTMSTTYSILKHRLFGIRFILGKIMLWFGIAMFFFVGFYVTLWLEQFVFSSAFDPVAIFLNVIIAFSLASIFSVFERELKEQVYKKIVYVSYDPDEVREELFLKLSSLDSVEEKLDTVLDTVEFIFKPKLQGLLLLDDSNGNIRMNWRGVTDDQLLILESESIVNMLLQHANDDVVSIEEFSLFGKDVSDSLKSVGIEEVIPSSKGSVIAFYLLGGKKHFGSFTRENIDDLKSILTQVIESIS